MLLLTDTDKTPPWAFNHKHNDNNLELSSKLTTFNSLTTIIVTHCPSDENITNVTKIKQNPYETNVSLPGINNTNKHQKERSIDTL